MAIAAIPDRSLASCQAVAATFDNTCENGEALADFANHEGNTVSCTGRMQCPEAGQRMEYSESNKCEWKRKLCVSCSENSDGVVMVKVQSNSLPNHCYQATVNSVEADENEWEVVWNSDVSNQKNYSDADFDSSAKTDEILCDIQRTKSTNMLDQSQFKILNDDRRMLQSNRGPPGGGGGAEPLGTAAGIALTGAYIYNSLAGGNVDAVENELLTLDVCLSHPTPFNQYHYHFWSACLKKGKGWWSEDSAPPLCRETDFCSTVPAGFGRNFADEAQEPAYTKDNWDEVIGIAKDGHVIIGPYQSNGEIWGCNRDVCNGAFVDGSYVYVGSDQFPYVVGCWGPGPEPLYRPGCSSNGCGSIASAYESGSTDLSSLSYATTSTLAMMTAATALAF